MVARESDTKERRSSTATVQVTVRDENDNPPVFEQERYTVSVDEDAANDTRVATVTATDRDSGAYGEAEFRYQLIGDHVDKFIIDHETAAIRTAPCATPGRSPCLDYETRSTYFLTLKVGDDQGRGNNAMVPLRIDLVDSNDNPPRFEQPLFRVSVDEGASKFDPPFKARARDDDLTSVLNYTITSGNTNDLFVIDSRTGQMGLTKPLELNSSLITTEEFTLTVEVIFSFFLFISFVVGIALTTESVRNAMGPGQRRQQEGRGHAQDLDPRRQQQRARLPAVGVQRVRLGADAAGIGGGGNAGHRRRLRRERSADVQDRALVVQQVPHGAVDGRVASGASVGL